MVENRKSGQIFQDLEGGPELIVVSSGEFTMGSPSNEPERGEEEGPRHIVTIGSPLAVGRFAVTFEEFDHFIASSGYHHTPGDGGWQRGRRPVVNVSYEDAHAYCQWLTNETGHLYRLLSEAEWEYVARAGTETPFWFGTMITPEQANYDTTCAYNGGSTSPSKEMSVPVGTFEANAFGLYETHGNVWEWVEDTDHSDYTGAPVDGKAWVSSSQTNMRVLRGGSFKSQPAWSRSASRVWSFADERDFDIGFRVVRSLERSG